MHRYLQLLVAAILMCALWTPGAVNAQGFQQQMRDTFGSMTNVSEPTVVMNSTRGVISGGSFMMKNKVITADLMSLSLPRIKMGCGGWDIFGGSFSFISSEQIVAMLRSIAASAVAYSFKLALCNISDDICNALENLWKDNIFSNFMGRNSCEMGQQLATAFMGGFGITANQAGANASTSEGEADDHADAQNNMGNQTPAQEQAVETTQSDDPEVKFAIIRGNHVWQALRRNDAPNWGSYGGTQFMEDVMSITGTIIDCAPKNQGCPGSNGQVIGQEDVVRLTRAPVMGLSELVKGRLDYSKVKRWRCNDAENCLNPVEATDASFKGMEELLREALLGANNSPGQGLIGRYANNTGSPTEAEKGLITAGGTFVAMALNLAARNEQDARDFVEAFSEIMAADITYRIVNESLGKASAAMSTLESGAAVDAQKLVAEARVRMSGEIQKFHSNNLVNTSKWEYYRGVVNARPPVKLPAISVATGK